MDNLKELENWIRTQGWFSGQLKLEITLKSEFEGFYGKASEDWEKQVIMKLTSPDESKFPNVEIKGRPYESIDDVAKRMNLQILKHKTNNK